MPRLSRYAIRTDASLWTRSGANKFGDPTFTASTDIKIHLEKVKVNQLDPNGEVLTSDAIAHLEVEVTEGSLIRVGKVVDLPAQPDNLWEVVSYNEIPDIRNQVQERWVTLNHYQGTLLLSGFDSGFDSGF